MAGMTQRSRRSFILVWVHPCNSLDAALQGGFPIHTMPLNKAKHVGAGWAVLQDSCLQILVNFSVSTQTRDRRMMLQSKRVFGEISLRQPWPEQQPHTMSLTRFLAAGRCQGQLLIAHPQTSVPGLKWQLRCPTPWFWSGLTMPRIRKGPTKSPFNWFFILPLCVISVKQKCHF